MSDQQMKALAASSRRRVAAQIRVLEQRRLQAKLSRRSRGLRTVLNRSNRRTRIN